MPRILILYGTTEGQTARIADAIALRMRAASIEANVVQAGTADLSPAGYDGVIVAASIHAGGYQKPVANWLREHAAEFGHRPTAFVSICLAIQSKQEKARAEANAIPRRFVDGLHWQPTVIKVIAGALPYSKYNFFVRWMMRRIAASAGGDTDTSRDYEYTDWEDVREFAVEFSRRVAGAMIPIMTLDIKRILVPLDFSANSNRVLDYALGIASKFGAAIHLVHVCEVPTVTTPSIDAYAIAYTDWSKRLGSEAETELLNAKSRIAGLDVTIEVLWGHAAPAIIEEASAARADLIVMGTHGHGAVMHMVMGNVAERVVRGAPCPVLTVREPRAREVATGKAWKLAAAGAAVFLGVLLLPSAAAAQDPPMKQVTPGSAVFHSYCVSCHGNTARGDGPLASAMTRKPANLTEIAKRNGGQFPSDMVFRTIDGRQPVRGHGGSDMPVWGEAFARSREVGDTERVKAVIQSLVDYLESIQLRAAHDQQQ